MKAPTIAILAALGGFQAAAQRISDTPVWVDSTTCDPWARSHGFPAAGGPDGLFTVALGIFDTMTHANMYRMFNPSKQSPATLPANVLAWERYRLNSTFDAFFGSGVNTGTSWATEGVWTVLLNIRMVLAQWGPETGKPHVTVVCDDAPYLSKNSNGKVVYTDPYNHSPVQLPGDSSVNDGVTTGCATNGQSSYEHYNVGDYTENVILCTKNVNLPLGFTSKGPTAFGSGTTVDVMGKSWLGALYTQALWTAGAIEAPAHGFAASHAIRNTHPALWNPDNNKFYAFALMFDGLFWGSGVGQTSQQEYARLQKTAAGKRIIAAFGLTNIAVPARGITWAPGWAPPDLMDTKNRHIEAIPRS